MHENEFSKVLPKKSKIAPGPHSQNPRFEPKPDYPFPHEPKSRSKSLIFEKTRFYPKTPNPPMKIIDLKLKSCKKC